MIARADALAALRRVLRSAAITDGCSAIDVVEAEEDAAFHVVVTWRSRRRRYRLRVPADDEALGTDLAAGIRFDELGWQADADAWAHAVRLWLQEGLDTGMLAWGRRTELPDGTVVVDRTRQAALPSTAGRVSDVPLVRPGWVAGVPPPVDSGVFVLSAAGSAEAPLEPEPLPGRHLATAGFDPVPGRRRQADGTLVGWLQLWSDGGKDAAACGARGRRAGDRPGGRRARCLRTQPWCRARIG